MDSKFFQRDSKILEAVISDYKQNNRSDKKCPYCGTAIIKKDYKKGYSIQCETENCFRETCRGI